MQGVDDVAAVVRVCGRRPTQMFRNRLRATIISAVAPQMPSCGPSPNGSMRQGPMKQFRQQIPSLPKPHCGCWAFEAVPGRIEPRPIRQDDHLLGGRIGRTLVDALP